ncbi:MAG: hypothetical protein ASARMPREDX12_004426 [Alectoria sarmentosa]|nr:MAG: hypothetical protein ASARMPREDX12_004426 [Alectoria sarmentosa]
MAKTEDADATTLVLAMGADSAEKVWYFAYGSNMLTSVMRNRGITTLAKEMVVVPSHVLSFDVFGVPYSEPAMASITRKEEFLRSDQGKADHHLPPVHGVAYLISHADYLRLLVSEGAGTAYEEVDLEAVPIQNTEEGEGDKGEEPIKVLKVHALIAKYPFRQNFSPRPATRYLNLLIQGAAEHGLPASYQTYLHSLPAFTKNTSKRAAIGGSIFHFLWMPPIQRVMRWIKGANILENGRSQKWTGTVVWIMFTAMWLHHDWIHARIWGRGDGRLASEARMAD